MAIFNSYVKLPEGNIDTTISGSCNVITSQVISAYYHNLYLG
jgi:hypothetical protein